MAHVALVGPEIEENLSLRYIASSLAARGHESDIIAFNGPGDFSPALAQVLASMPAVVGVSLAFSAGSLVGDAGAEGGAVQKPRLVRLELSATSTDLFGSVSPVGSNVTVLQQTNVAGHSSINLSITGPSAALDIARNCGFGQQLLRVELGLTESDVSVTVREL